MKLLMTMEHSLPGEKADLVVSRLCEFLNCEPEDIMVLPAGVTLHAMEAGPKKAKSKPAEDLEELTVEELRAKAHKEGINLHSASTKAEIIQAIQKGDKS